MVSRCSSEVHRYYHIGPTYATRYFWGRVDLDSLGVAVDWRHRQMAHFSGCIVLKVAKGTVASDFVWNGLLLPVVSDRVVQNLQTSSISGWKTYRVRILRKSEEIPGYHGLGITGRGGPNHPKAYAGGLISGTTIRKVEGLFPTEWDGSDLFTLDDIPGAILATEKVRRLFKREKVTNCEFRPAEEFSIGRGIH